MLIVETIGRIGREHLVKGKSIKEIARDLNISRNTVRKILRSGKTSFSYEREVQPLPKLGRWKAEIDRLLTINIESAARERMTLIRAFEELRALGYEGGYDAVRRYARSWGRAHAEHTAAAYASRAGRVARPCRRRHCAARSCAYRKSHPGWHRRSNAVAFRG
jgi:transposase